MKIGSLENLAHKNFRVYGSVRKFLQFSFSLRTKATTFNTHACSRVVTLVVKKKAESGIEPRHASGLSHIVNHAYHMFYEVKNSLGDCYKCVASYCYFMQWRI